MKRARIFWCQNYYFPPRGIGQRATTAKELHCIGGAPHSSPEFSPFIHSQSCGEPNEACASGPKSEGASFFARFFNLFFICLKQDFSILPPQSLPFSPLSSHILSSPPQSVASSGVASKFSATAFSASVDSSSAYHTLVLLQIGKKVKSLHLSEEIIFRK